MRELASFFDIGKPPYATAQISEQRRLAIR
jgi:hypothetical protein